MPFGSGTFPAMQRHALAVSADSPRRLASRHPGVDEGGPAVAPIGLRTAAPRVVLALLAAAVCGALGPAGGCASVGQEATTGASDPTGVVPADLAIELRVVPHASVAGRAKVEERSARFVLLADGSLHGETDRLPPEGARPAWVRRLDREQMAVLWSALTAAGFSDPARADTRGNVRLTAPAGGQVLATLEVHAFGERFAFVRSYGVDDERELALRRVVRTVASLAWAADEALAESAELPMRYDAGPDPYARFAPPAGAAK